MGDSAGAPELIEDAFGLLKLYSDGSITRSEIHHKIPIIHNDGAVAWADHLFDKTHSLHLRLYKPTNIISPQKLPILVYLHAGGFCFGSRTYPKQHNFCLRLASALGAVVVSPDYRLAPEHRLPAAYEDGYSLLLWLKDQALFGKDCDEADFENVFVFGDSSGGNTAHWLAIRLGPDSADLEPVRVRGDVLLSPFFGGALRTNSEEEKPCETFWTLDIYDRFWRLALPEGATQDHPYANPFGPTSPSLKQASMNPILLLVGEAEILRCRCDDYANRLKDMGKNVTYVEFEGQEHGFFTANPYSEMAKRGMQIIKDFMLKNSKL